MAEMSKQELADVMVKMVADVAGIKKFKSLDIIKAMIAQFGDRGVDKKMTKDVLKTTVNEGRLVFTYYGGSFVEVPHREGSAND